MSTARELAWLNGKIVPREEAAPSVVSNNLHLGTSVFEGIMAYWNDDHHLPHALSQHLRRFVAGTERMRLPIRFGVDELAEGIQELLRGLGPGDHYLRPLALRRRAELYDVRDLTEPADVIVVAVSAERDLDTPVRCCISPWRRVSSTAIPVAWKVSGAYANSMIAQYDAYERGYDTPLMLDQHGRISEACTSNVFFVRGDELITPSLGADVFPGITRSILIERAIARGITVVECDVFPGELGTFDNAFICATLLEMREIESINEHRYKPGNSEIYNSLLAEFRDATHGLAPAW